MRGTSTLAAFNHNELQANRPGSSGNGQRFADGQPLSAFYGLRYLGVEAATGQPRYQRLDSNGQLDFAAQQYLGAGLPRQRLSPTQQLSYRRLRGWHSSVACWATKCKMPVLPIRTRRAAMATARTGCASDGSLPTATPPCRRPKLSQLASAITRCNQVTTCASRFSRFSARFRRGLSAMLRCG